MSTNTRHAAPWTFRRIIMMFSHQPARPGPKHPDLMTGREAIARALFSEAVHGSKLDLLEYDALPHLQSAWLHVADRHIEHAKSSDRHVAAFHCYTPEAWYALPPLAKVDLRESFYEGKGWRK